MPGFNAQEFVENTMLSFVMQIDGLGLSYAAGVELAERVAEDVAQEIEFAARERTYCPDWRPGA